MKNIWINNKKQILPLLYVIIVIICIIAVGLNKKGTNETNKNILNGKEVFADERSDNSVYEYAKVYLDNNKNYIINDFENRVGVIKNNNILIGTNLKELENGYYDICISLNENKLEVSIAKLWKEVNSKEVYDKYYIKELAICILDICKKNYTELEIQTLEKYLLDSYLTSKKEKPTFENCKLDNINISSKIKDGILLMSI